MIFFDAHLHLYDGFALDLLFDRFAARAARAVPAGAWAVALMERQGQARFAAWSRALAAGDPVAAGRWRLLRQADATCLVFAANGREIHLFAGRQVAAAERVEALALFMPPEAPPPADGLPLAATLDALRAAGALPLLAWGLGKWLFSRAAVVRRCLAEGTPETLLVADSALRPAFWGEPRPMATARRRGLRVLAGSDPLPRPGAESVAGQYATRIAGDLDPRAPSASLRHLLLSPATRLDSIGRRHGPLATLRHFL